MKTPDFTKLETWMYGLFAAIISSAATTGAALLSSNISGKGIDWPQLGVSLGISSLVAAFLYLQKSPLPSDTTIQQVSIEPDGTKTTTTATIPPKS